MPRLAPVGDAVRVPKGHGHECWRVQTAAGPMMVKLALHGAGDEAMRNLAEALSSAAAGGVPCPRLHWFGAAPAGLGAREMLIQDFLPGMDGEEALPGMGAARRRRYFHDFGAAVAKLHAVSRPASFADMVEARLRRLAESNREARVLSQDALDGALARISDGVAKVSPVVTPALMHGDLYPPNTLVAAGRFVALLDFEHAKPWDPVHDFVKLGFWTFEPHPDSRRPFMAGYGPLPEAFEARLDIATGLELLAGFPYWKRHAEPRMLADWRRRFDRWL